VGEGGRIVTYGWRHFQLKRVKTDLNFEVMALSVPVVDK
ncbi:hypothetical protein Tco_1581347, partial [Tanacetum coccineum]